MSEEEETDVAKYRGALPQLGDDFFMTDGVLETTLIFLEGQDLPHFAAFLLQVAELLLGVFHPGMVWP